MTLEIPTCSDWIIVVIRAIIEIAAAALGACKMIDSYRYIVFDMSHQN